MLQNKLTSIQSIRGLAALCVVVCHYTYNYIIWNKISYNFDGSLFEYLGKFGVDVFFIISGFVIYKSLENLNRGFNGFLKFAISRITRVIPLYWCATLLMIYLSRNYDIQQIFHSILFVPLMGYLPILGVGWTLNYEMYFYLILAISVVVMPNKLRFLFLVTFFIGTLFFLPYIFHNHYSSYMSIFRSYSFSQRMSSYEYLNLITSPLILFFLVGMFFYRFKDKLKPPSSFIMYVLLVFAFVGILPCLYSGAEVRSSFAVLCITPIIIFYLGIFSYRNKFINKVLHNRYLVLSGEMSYSIYLLHLIIMSAFSIGCDMSGIKFLGDNKYSVGLYIISFIFTIIFSYFSYLLIEIKLSNVLKKRLFSVFKVSRA